MTDTLQTSDTGIGLDPGNLPRRGTLTGVPEGFDAMVLADLARPARGRDRAAAPVLHIARDEARLNQLADALAFFAPELSVTRLPAWDCLPYDRVSPTAGVVARRLSALADLLGEDRPAIVLTTVNAALQRLPAPDLIAGNTWQAAPGRSVDLDELIAFLGANGFSRTGTVVEPGDYAVRGGIIDIYPPGAKHPVRLDLFGDTLESIRTFDPQTQRTVGQLRHVRLLPASEVILSDDAVARFRTGYVARFGGVSGADPLYEAISAGQRYQGMEHWLPLFHERLATVFDHVRPLATTFDHLIEDATAARREQIGDAYEARREALDGETWGAPAYKPLPPDALYIPEDEWTALLGQAAALRFSPFDEPESETTGRIVAFGVRQGRSFAPERAEEGRNVFEAVSGHVRDLRAAGKRVILAAWTAGSRERLAGVLSDHGAGPAANVADWPAAQRLDRGTLGLAVLGLERGFETRELAVIAEQDMLGDRLVRRARRTSRGSDFIAELSTLTPGDLVVHVDHGIGRFEGLQTLDVQGAPHDCLLLIYRDGDRLFLPVENLELLSRYGSDDAGVQLDKLGGAGWQSRKARLKQRIRDIADKLIRTAAARELKRGETMAPQPGAFEEFSARFPYEETEDQQAAIDDVIADLARGRPMDRLVCGDVGFGKTEVALRSAFIAVMEGKQVAVVVPTTLLARQHYATFTERFRGLPVRIAQASRLVPAATLKEVKAGLASGDVDIVIGTHALLGKTIRFHDLGLLIVDEEQHFGVAHKERLKELKANVHVLTLTATPIPRTLQLALSGVRELSIINTPPVDRLAVRTFITPFDPVIVREALLRELYRGGQSFYVCPRISDLDEVRRFLEERVPEVKFAVAHGQMSAKQLEDVMSAFYDGQFNVLLCTTIVESGLDIPTANTLIVHRADMFGLAQLYQLRGRVGRSKVRAYALLTVPANRTLTAAADKRLKVLQSLDSLGAGFMLASHDLDIRGAGNLLGEEQSGHIREVGFELYQDMLEEAVASLRSGAPDDGSEDTWSPQISIGTAVLIPEHYVADLQVRLGLYRRLADVETLDDVEAFGAELIDRFGPLPEEVEHLLQIVAIKTRCRDAGIASVDAGPKGVVLGFRNDRFANPAGLVRFISEQGSLAKLRPDHKLVLKRDWPTPAARLEGTRAILSQLAAIAGQAEAA